MKKLVKGILEFRQKLKASDRDVFAKLALGQKPDALFIGCSDSRVAVNVFASTDPGDLFVNRNVGNMVPVCKHEELQLDGVSAVIEFAIHNLKVKHIIVCGHSECGAMIALVNGIEKIETKGLRTWLSQAMDVIGWLTSKPDFAKGLTAHNRLSQLNVIKQIENLSSYPVIQQKVKAGDLFVHGWWFDIAEAKVFSLNDSGNYFAPMDEAECARILEKISVSN